MFVYFLSPSYDCRDQWQLDWMGQHDAPYSTGLLASRVVVASPSNGNAHVSECGEVDITGITAQLPLFLPVKNNRWQKWGKICFKSPPFSPKRTVAGFFLRNKLPWCLWFVIIISFVLYLLCSYSCLCNFFGEYLTRNSHWFTIFKEWFSQIC